MTVPSPASLRALLKKATDFFDVTVLSKMDLSVEGDKVVYVDPLGNRTQPIPTDMGCNLYYIHGPDDKFRQEIYFQNGSPVQGVNGLSNESIISVVLHRLSKNNEAFPSPYNVLGIYLLQGALAALHARVKDRKDFGIHDTVHVDPTDTNDPAVARALSIVNSVGLLANVIFKFDSAYALHEPNKIHGLLDVLINQVPDAVGEVVDVNIATAFSFISTVTMGSGIVRGFASIARQFAQVQKMIIGENDGTQTAPAEAGTTPTTPAATAGTAEETAKDNPAHYPV